MNRQSITAAAALLLLPLAVPGSLAHAATDDRSGPSVTRIITLDSAPASQRSSPKERAAARHAADDSQRELVDAAGHAGIPLTVHRHYHNVVNGLVVKVPAAQADRLTALPGVASVSKPVVYEAPEKPTPVSEDVLGAKGERSSNVLSLAVDNLVASGTPTVVSVGNGYARPFNVAAPAVANGAIAVGSTYSNRYPYLAFTLDDGSITPVPYQDSGRAPAAPATGSSPITPMASPR
ncbi:S8 family serine peptidase [Streptomyces sp. R-74717]|uniref:protease inhibitor I9 family protein n=1 Tax=Streptomyces sp. R-74717 TaxID=2969820 RepID=UPI0039B62F4A